MFDERLLLTLPLLLVGCGSMVGGGYRGKVLLEIEGTVRVAEDAEFANDIGVALLWTNDAQEAAGAQSVVVSTSFPARYTIQVFREPAENTRLSLLGFEDLRASIGQIVLYEDLDGDGAWAGPGIEPVVGGAYDSAVVWIQDEADAQDSVAEAMAPVAGDTGDEAFPAPWGVELESWTPRGGFQLVDVPIPPACGLPISDIFYERSDNRATLHVGGLRNAYYDWDCDGSSEFAEDDPESPLDFAWGPDECGPPEALEADCEFLVDVLNEPAAFFGPGGENEDLFPPFWLECLMAFCPEQAADFQNLTSEP